MKGATRLASLVRIANRNIICPVTITAPTAASPAHGDGEGKSKTNINGTDATVTAMALLTTRI